METWRELLGNAVLPLANFEDLSLIVQATMRISNGETVQSIIDEQSNRAAKQALLHTFAAII
jgi:galactitol-specific phosphotransferase system IIC component